MGYDAAFWRCKLLRQVWGEIFDDDEDFGGVRVDAARRFANDPLLRSVEVIGDDGIVPNWRLDIDVVND